MSAVREHGYEFRDEETHKKAVRMYRAIRTFEIISIISLFGAITVLLTGIGPSSLFSLFFLQGKLSPNQEPFLIMAGILVIGPALPPAIYRNKLQKMMMSDDIRYWGESK